MKSTGFLPARCCSTRASDRIEITDFVQKRISCLDEVLESSYFQPQRPVKRYLAF
ncbi:MAG: hypothetical protein ACLSAP_05430 [Oscillospiraceae bacterium]